MKKFILFAVLIAIQTLTVNAFAGNGNEKLRCTPTIATGTISPITICAGTIISVPFTFTDCVDAANIFTAQLSDASGSFATPTDIGSITSTTANNLIAIIPPTTTFGSGYRIRVIGSAPATIGTDNGFNLTLLPKPNATFNINNSSQCFNGNSFLLSNSSTGSITSYSWNLGDGNASSNTNVTYIYAAAGTYPITLTAIGTNSCRDSVTHAVTVQPKPVSNFTFTGPDLCATPIFNFTNTTTLASGTHTAFWSFGDGDTCVCTDPTHTYLAAGVYTVKLVSTSNNGCKDSISKTVNVLDKPIASFLVNNTPQCLLGNNFIFPNFSTGAGITHSWSFGDGATSAATNASHSYSTAGTSTVKLVVTNINGCKDSMTNTVTVTANALAAFNVVGSTLCSSNLAVNFNNTSTGSTYAWNFGDGNTSPSFNATNTYAAAGTYIVKLVVTNAAGCKDSTTQSISLGAKPVAAFNIVGSNRQCVFSNLFVYNNTSTGTGNTYVWDLGDGLTSTLTSPSKAYSIAGNLTVTLIATNSNGCKDTTSLPIIVDALPVPKFTITGNTSCASNLTATFTNISTGATSYNWNFGDGNTSIATSPTNAYATSGFYIIRLVAATAFGCKDSTERSITFATKPTVGFTVNSLSQCVNTGFAFTNTSTGTGLTYTWNFGDGVTSPLQNPSKSYSVAGTYIVKLVVTNSNNCKDSLSQTITVSAKPSAAFTTSGSINCSTNLSITTAATTPLAGETYSWNFGDGNIGSTSTVSNTYAVAGNYTIKLVVTNANGCKDSTTQNVSFSTKPTAAFTVNNNSQCVNNNNFTFTNNSGIGNTYAWDFGDFITSTLQNPSKSYSVAGNYTVRLIVTNANGCKDTATQIITVLAKPSPAFTTSGATNCTTNLTINTAVTTPLVGETYLWSFGDGNTSTAINATNTYAVAGTYTIKLVVTNANGCKDSSTQNVTFSTNPIAGFTVNNSSQCINGNNFIFTNTTTGIGNTYSWNFGDLTTSTVTNLSKSYAVAGVYNVKLVVTTATGCKDSITQFITVFAKPSAAFTTSGSTNCSTNLTINTTNTASSAGETYLWSFGDGNTSTALNATNTYVVAGTYNIKLVVTNANGCKDSSTQNVTFSTNPTASFNVTSTSQCLNGNNFTFNNTSVGGSTYAWNFGDNTTSSLTSPVKAYAAAGTYTVKLVVTTANGCKDSTTQTVSVFGIPVASFTLIGATNCTTNKSFTTVNTSTGSGLIYMWNFGDGSGVSNQMNPSYTYATSGTYTIKLVVANSFGCVDSTSKSVTFSANPTAAFNVTSTSQCLNNNNFIFNNTSVGGATYFWDFGDLTTSFLTSPVKAYSAAGTFTIKLIVTTMNGCKDSTMQNVTVLAKPTASFTLVGATGCSASLNIVTNNTSTGSGNNYLWSFGDGSISVLTSPSYTYASVGTYIIKLVATNALACKDSATKTISFSTAPTASFTTPTTTQCLNNNNFNFTNTSVNAASYYWTFGDSTFSLLQNPIKSYSAVGTYTVKLVVTNSNGCKDSVTQVVTVLAKPQAIYTISGSTICTNNLTLAFNNKNVVIGNIYDWSFGDGTTSNADSPAKIYANFGTYTIKLVVTNIAGCKDSLSTTVTLTPAPKASFGIASSSLCSNTVFNFVDSSTGTSTPSYYYWDFGDGTFSLLQNPVKAYSAAGAYKVLMYVTNANGCKDSISKSVTIVTKPKAVFTIPNFNGCSNSQTLTFTNTSTNATSYAWDFGDGTNSAATSPTKSFTGLGTYTITLIATNANGCSDTAKQTFNLIAKPVAAFNVASTTLCSGTTFTFSDASTNVSTPSYYYWDFGDGTFSLLQNPVKAYSAAGTFKVLMYVTNANGCKDSISKSVTIVTKPKAVFTIPNFNGCSNSQTLTFTNTSTNATSYTWDFGDGTNSTATSPTKSFSGLGTYTITLIVSNTNGCSDTTSQTFNLIAKPVAAFNVASTTLCSGTTFTFTDASTNISTPSYYYWDFGDGTFSLLQNPVKAYSAAGTFKVLMFVTNANGCKDSISKSVTIVTKPKAIFTIPNFNGCSNSQTLTFTNTSTNATSYAWNFGDGTNSTATSPTKSFSGLGTYTITLIATNANGCSDTTSQTFNLIAKPVAAFNVASTTLCSGTTFTFSDASTNVSTPSYNYWDFGDGTFSLLQNPVKAYSAAGTFKVLMFVTNANGCKDSISKSVTIVTKPKAVFTIPNFNGCSNSQTLTFTNTSTNATSYAWDFGDGTNSTATSPTKSFTGLGTYTITLIATNANGCSDTTSQTFNLIAKPVAAFNVASTTLCSGTTFTFSDASTNVSTPSYNYWDFGDGTFSLLQNPVKAYSAAGTFKVLMFVTNANGCKDSISKSVTIVTKPKAVFTIPNFNGCSNSQTLTFTNTSTNATSYAWDFGDGTNSTATSPTKSFTGLGTYTITLIATNASGCTDTATQTINFVAKPIASFNVSGLTGCSNNSFSFTDNSTVVAPASYYYDFGDGTISLLQNPTHTYSNAGTYKVVFFVSNANGCKDSTSRTITVIAKPKASFTLLNFSPCSNNFTITTNNTSTNATNYFWDFGDGILTNQSNITKTFAGIGTYTITLIATNASGCSDTAKQIISFIAKPIASFSVSSSGTCTNTVYTFTDNSTVTGAASYYYDFGDNTISTLQNPTHTYGNAGTYKVIFFVTNANGCKDSTSKLVTVIGKPIISYSINGSTQCLYGNFFTFTNTSPNQAGVSYFWDFGDGILSSQQTINKVYAFTGTFRVSLIATNSNGCVDSLVKTVTVVDKPTPSFTISQNNQCVNNGIVFTNTTITTVNTNYTWKFGDGTTSTQTSVAHSYNISGTYTVTLVATNIGGCVDSVSQTVFVTAKPVASFTTQDANPCTGAYVAAFTNTTTGNISSYVWTFSDGTISTDVNPIHTYTTAGSYTVKLLAISVSGCRDSVTKTITLQSHLSSAFTINNITQCINSNSFSFRSVLAGQSNITYKWDLGDGTTASTAAVTKSYLLAGSYTVKLVVANIVTGCKDSSTTVVNVKFQPAASLVGSGTICNGNSFIINVNFAGTPPFSFTYNDGISNHFIGGINTVVYGLGVSPTTTTTYRIIAMNDAYCSASTADIASTSSTVTVNNAAFTINPANTTTCVGTGASLLASATANTAFTYQWQKNGVDILGATDSVYKVSTATLIDTGNYRVALVLGCGRVYSSTAYLAVVAAPLPPAFSANVNRCQYDTARPLVASGDRLLWYTTATGGLASPIAPMPNTLLTGTQQYWVSNSNSIGCESQRYLMTVNVLPSATVSIDVIGSTVLLPTQTTTLIATPSLNTTSLIWIKDNQIVSFNNSNQLTVGFKGLGVYQAQATASSGCATRSNSIEITAPKGLEPRAEGVNLRLYPNPATTVVNAYFDNPVNQTLTVRLVNQLGQELQSKVVNYTSRFQLVQFDVSKLGYGTYAIEVLNSFGNTIARNLFVKAN